jgi:hypothetical protein
MNMPESLMTIFVDQLDTPVAVVNWDEIEDGELEVLLSSKMFLDWAGINLNNESGADEETARLAAARTFFTWRDASEDERVGWERANKRATEQGEEFPFFVWDPRGGVH